MSVLSRAVSEPPESASDASGEEADEEEEEEEDEEEDDRRGGVARMERKGDMRGVPVRVRVSPGVVMRDARGRMGRETRGTIVRKKGKRGSIRRIVERCVL